MGLLLIVMSSYQSSSTKALQISGIRAEVVVNELSRDASGISTGNNIFTVRFTTQNGQWITGTAKNDFLVTYHSQYKLGERVKVIYDQTDPYHFIVDSKQAQRVLRMLMTVIGIILLIVSLYSLLKHGMLL